MILGGTTSTQGGGSDPADDSLLARNVESINFGRQADSQSRGRDWIAQRERRVGPERGRCPRGLLDAWLVHLAEGVRDGDCRAGDTKLVPGRVCRAESEESSDR